MVWTHHLPRCDKSCRTFSAHQRHHCCKDCQECAEPAPTAPRGGTPRAELGILLEGLLIVAERLEAVQSLLELIAPPEYLDDGS